jgi:hypothetical protein
MNSEVGTRIVGIDPIRRGFAYVAIEAPNRLIDWGIHRGSTDEGIVRRLEDILARLRPEVLIIEDFENWPETSLRTRARDFLNGVRLIAFLQGLRLETISRREVRERLGTTTKQQLATVIAERFPELAPRLPRPRRPWMSEAPSANIFDACSLVLAFLAGDGE